MAALQMPGDVKCSKMVDISVNQVAGFWTVVLRSASDTIVVPGLESTSAVGSLKPTTTVSAGALTEGNNTVTIAGGAAGDVFTFATLHRKGMVNNLSIDEDPT